MKRQPLVSDKTKEIIDLLSRLRFSFSREHAKVKLGIVNELRERIISIPKQLISYHEALCFMQAYPDSPEVIRAVDQQLEAFPERVRLFKQAHTKDKRLDETGMADTALHYPYNYLMSQWLRKNFGSAVDIDWDDYNQKKSDPVSGLLPIIALYMENDGIDDEDLATENWIKMSLGRGKNTLQWLLDHFDRLSAPIEVKQYVYENAELTLRWNLGKSKASRTFAKLPGSSIFFSESPLKKPVIDLARSVRKPAPVFALVRENRARDLINVLIRSLLPRHRELYPATYANSREVYWTTPGEGLDIYILGMRPESRMPLETNYSALLIKNGVPIGYGISVMFFDRCEIAINVFETFRSGEASLIFEHFVRVFYHHFGGRNFLMRRWQVGYENDEGIKSGSFWFYYKLGFRPLDPKVDQLATAEWQKIQADRSYRTDEKRLRRLARSDMHLGLAGRLKEPYRELSVVELGFAVTRMVAARFNGDRRGASKWASSRTAASLRRVTGARWTRLERMQLGRFGPLLALITDWESWSKKEKRELADIIKSKAAPQERHYALKLQKHKRLYRAFREIGRSV